MCMYKVDHAVVTPYNICSQLDRNVYTSWMLYYLRGHFVRHHIADISDNELFLFNDNIDELLADADKKDLDYLILTWFGVYSSDFWNWHDECLNYIQRLDHEQPDWLIACQIIDKEKQKKKQEFENVFYAYPICAIINMNTWRELGKPAWGEAGEIKKIIKPRPSEECVHDDYTPWLLHPSSESATVTTEEGWNFINASLEEGYMIQNLPIEIRKPLHHSYPENDPWFWNQTMTKFMNVGMFENYQVMEAMQKHVPHKKNKEINKIFNLQTRQIARLAKERSADFLNCFKNGLVHYKTNCDHLSHALSTATKQNVDLDNIVNFTEIPQIFDAKLEELIIKLLEHKTITHTNKYDPGIFFLYNTETIFANYEHYREIWSTVDTVIGPCSMFKAFILGRHIPEHPATKYVHYDIYERNVFYKEKITKDWNGTLEHLHEVLKSLDSDSYHYWTEEKGVVDQVWKMLQTHLGNDENIEVQWLEYQKSEHRYVLANAMHKDDKIIEALEELQPTGIFEGLGDIPGFRQNILIYGIDNINTQVREHVRRLQNICPNTHVDVKLPKNDWHLFLDANTIIDEYLNNKIDDFYYDKWFNKNSG